MKMLWTRHFNHMFLCPICAHSLTSQLPICRYCQKSLPRLSMQRCAGNLLNFPEYYDALEHNHWHKLVCATRYRWPVNHLITELKFAGHSELADFLARLLARQVAKTDSLPQALLAIPLHPKRQKKRGYNQAELICKTLAKQFNLPLLTDVIYRLKQGTPQSELSGSKRRKNLSKAFAVNTVNAKTLPEHVAIIDDVVTTGSTVNEVAKLLKCFGVKTIDVWAVALTDPQPNKG